MRNPPYPVVFGFILLCVGCEAEAPVPPPGTENFTEYYAEEVLLIEQNRLTGKDSTASRQGLDSVRSRFSISAAGRDSLIRYYQDSLPRWEAFLSNVLERLESKERASNQEPPKTPESPASQPKKN